MSTIQTTTPTAPLLAQQPSPEPDDFDRQILFSSSKKSYPKCRICSALSAKYTCPGCSKQTCSLACIKKHKLKSGCSGSKQPTKYIKKKQYNPTDSKRDYNYLMTTIDEVDRVKKDFTGVGSLVNDQKNLKLIKKYGKEMYQIDLKIAPTIIQKHRNNISFFFMKTNEFYWVFELCYLIPTEEGKEIEGKWERFITNEPICDGLPIVKIFDQERVSNNLLTKYGINTAKIEDFCVLVRNKYRYGFLAPDSHAFDKEGYLYIEVDLKERIVDILKGLTIYEFPSLCLVHKGMMERFRNKWRTSSLEDTK